MNVIEWRDTDIDLTIDGMGIVFYSEGSIETIEEGEDYFHKEYDNPQQVAAHLQKGDMVGFCTGSGGNYLLKFRSGYPTLEIEQEFPIAIRLAIDVKGGKLSMIDLFWLLEWSKECPPGQQFEIEDGIYHMTVLTAKPSSGLWGDNQIIYIYFNKLDSMPKLTWTGVPLLFES